MFNLVEFTSTKDTAVIPSLWKIEDTSAVWPPYQSASRTEKAVRNRDAPCKDWIRYSVRVLYSLGKI